MSSTYEDSVVVPHSSPEMQDLMGKVTERLNAYLVSLDSTTTASSTKQPVLEWEDPVDLQGVLRAMTPELEGHLNITAEGGEKEGGGSHSVSATLSAEGSDKVVSDFAFLLDRTVKMAHKKCLNQLFHQADTVAILADYLVATINTSIYTLEMNPVVTMVELETLRKLHLVLGWNPETSCGTLPPGGSYSNLYGMLCARTKMFPHVAAEGWKAEDRPLVFVSAAAHYSGKKAAALMGMGYNALIPIETDEWHRMKPSALSSAIEDAIAQGKKPFCVVATVGTTLMGAIDPLKEIAALCKANGIWFHVDACLGGGFIHSPTLRSRYLAGIELADSIAYNAHKMMGITQQCSIFLTQHRQIQVDTFATRAAYLFNADKQYDAEIYDVGDRVFQCARRPDCLKLWLIWRYRGDQGMGAYVDLAFKRHVLFNKVLSGRPDFVPVLGAELQSESTLPSCVPCTCFWWVAKEFREGDAKASNRTIMESEAQDPVLFKSIDASTAKAKLTLMQRNARSKSKGDAPTVAEAASASDSSGAAFILTMSRAKNWPNFWRFVANGAHSWTEAEINSMLDDVSLACETCHLERK